MKPLLFPALLSCSAIAFAQQGAQPASGKPAVVQGSGCVAHAVESNCLVLKDSKTGDIYNLLFAENAPGAGTAVRFKGTEHQGMTSCMQGIAVNVTKWKRLKGEKCPVTQVETAH